MIMFSFEFDDSVRGYAPLRDSKGTSSVYSGSALKFDNYGTPGRGAPRVGRPQG